MRKPIKIASLIIILLLWVIVVLVVSRIYFQEVEEVEPLNAVIIIDADKPLKPVNRLVYGANIETHSYTKGAWDDKADNFSQGFINFAKELGVTIIRFPGGGPSDFYHWRNGIGPRESRPYSFNPFSNVMEPSNMGTDEFIELCRMLGAEPLITVNFGTGTPEEAAEWVNYTNIEKGYNVKYWEVGNEIYIKDERITVPPETYATKFIEFASAMKAVDPTIKVGAIGCKDTGNFPIGGYPDWNRVILEEAGEYIDFIALHNSYAPLSGFAGIGPKPKNETELYAATLAAPRYVKENIEIVKSQISTYAPDRADEIEIAITEYGPLYGWETMEDIDRTKNLASGLYTADIIFVFLMDDKVLMANFLPFIDPAFGGLITNSLTGLIRTPSYYALQMYTKHFGDVMVNSSVECATYESEAVGIVPAQTGVSYLDVIASKNMEGNKLYLLVINKHLSKPFETNIEINGFQPQAEAKVWTLNGPSIDSTNGGKIQSTSYEGPDTVIIKETSISKVTDAFVYTFAAHSLTVIEFTKLSEDAETLQFQEENQINPYCTSTATLRTTQQCNEELKIAKTLSCRSKILRFISNRS